MASVPAPVLSYLETFQTAWPMLADQDLASCLQYNADSSLPASITGGFSELPCETLIITMPPPLCTDFSSSTVCLTSFTTSAETKYPTPMEGSTTTTPVTLMTASILSRWIGAAVFTPAQVPLGVLAKPSPDSPAPLSAESAQDGPTVGSGGVQSHPTQGSAQSPNDGPSDDSSGSTPGSGDNEPKGPQQDEDGQMPTPAPTPDAPDRPQATPGAASSLGTLAAQGTTAQPGTNAPASVTTPGDPVGSYVVSGLGPGAGTGPPALPSVSGVAGLPSANSSATASISVPPSLGGAPGHFPVPPVCHLLAGLVLAMLVP